MFALARRAHLCGVATPAAPGVRQQQRPGSPSLGALRAVRLSAGRAARRCSSNGRSLVHPSAIAAKLATWRSVCAADEVPRGIARTRFVEVPQPLPLPLVMGQSLDAASVFHQPTPSEGECRHPSARSRRAASPSAGQGPRGQAHLSQRPMQFRWLPQGNGLSTSREDFPNDLTKLVVALRGERPTTGLPCPEAREAERVERLRRRRSPMRCLE